MTSTLYSNYKKTAIKVLALGFAICCTTLAKAQVNPFASQFYQNQYLFNPAMAGITEGLNINAAYAKQAIGVSGTQSIQAVSADYQMNKVGLGAAVTSEYSGLFRTTRAIVTYAYHLPLNGDNQKLNFGLSGGFVNQHLETSNIIGDQSDRSIANYNATNQTYVDGDFGVSYTDSKLTIQGTLPNLRTISKENNTAEREVFFTSASYKFFNPADISVEPKVVYRKTRGLDKNNIIDAGANVAFNNSAFNAQVMYHSSNSATFGVGFGKNNFSINAYYTTATSALNAYTNGDFEIGLRFNPLVKMSK